MRTTIDIPDELFRQVKARAALKGMKLKEYVTEALQDSLFRHRPVTEVRETETQYGEDVLVLREDCIFPLITGDTGEEMRSISGGRIEEILEEEEVEDALRPSGR